MSDQESPGVDLLLIEDDPADQDLLMRFLKEEGGGLSIELIGDGREALTYLDRCSTRSTKSGNRGYPSLILLDLKLPKVDGLDVLRKIRKDEQFPPIPVVVFTTIGDSETVQQTLLSGANAFIEKPEEIHVLRNCISRLIDFWFKTTTLLKQ